MAIFQRPSDLPGYLRPARGVISDSIVATAWRLEASFCACEQGERMRALPAIWRPPEVSPDHALKQRAHRRRSGVANAPVR